MAIEYYNCSTINSYSEFIISSSFNYDFFFSIQFDLPPSPVDNWSTIDWSVIPASCHHSSSKHHGVGIRTKPVSCLTHYTFFSHFFFCFICVSIVAVTVIPISLIFLCNSHVNFTVIVNLSFISSAIIIYLQFINLTKTVLTLSLLSDLM